MHNIIGTDVASGSFKIRAAALTAAGLVETMKNTDRRTVFAQKGDASAEISKAGLDALLDDKHKSKSVPTHHGCRPMSCPLTSSQAGSIGFGAHGRRLTR